MITRIFNNHYSSNLNPMNLLNAEELQSLSIVFDSHENRDLFFASLQKSIGARKSEFCNDEKEFAMISVVISSINEVTGLANESGLKRMTKFHKAIEAQLNSQK